MIWLRLFQPSMPFFAVRDHSDCTCRLPRSNITGRCHVKGWPYGLEAPASPPQASKADLPQRNDTRTSALGGASPLRQLNTKDEKSLEERGQASPRAWQNYGGKHNIQVSRGVLNVRLLLNTRMLKHIQRVVCTSRADRPLRPLNV